MKWNSSSPKPSMLVYYYMKMNGLAPFTVTKDRFCPPTLLSKIHSLWLAAIRIFATITAAITLFKSFEQCEFPVFGQFRAGIHLAINLPTTWFNVTIFLLTYEKVLYVMNKLREIGNELKTLGIEEDDDKFFKNILATIVATDSVIIAICVTLGSIDTEWPMPFVIIDTIDTWQYVNVGLIFIQILIFVRQRFKLINEDLYSAFRPADRQRSLDRLRIFSARGNPREEIRTDIEGLTDFERIQKIELLHLELCELVDRATDLFAIPILMSSLQISVELMLHSFRIYGLVRDWNQLGGGGEIVSLLRSIASPVLRMILPILQLLAYAHASTTTCREGNATKAVLSMVWHQSNSQELGDEFLLFSLQLLHKPVDVSVFGFLGLDYTHLYKVLCAVVAYLVIMIQFDMSEPNTGA